VLAGALLLGGVGRGLSQPATPVAGPAPRPVAVVYGTEISLAQVDAVLRADGPAPLHLPQAQRRQRQFEALSLLIDALLMHHFLDKQVGKIEPKKVDDCLKQMDGELRKQSKSLDEFCQETNQTREALRTSVADRLRWVSYAERFATDAALEKYYQDYRDFFEGTTVRASHIVLRVPGNASAQEKAQARDKLEALRKELVAGKRDFAGAAKAYSQDPRGEKGGDLGFFPRRWAFDESFLRAAFALPVGQISEVVETECGYHLIQVTERTPGKPFDYRANKERVKELFVEDLRERVLAQERKAISAQDLQINLP
jgi:peptidyl-prolyl cis-trans isomerase C